jgi:hypothetical protein
MFTFVVGVICLVVGFVGALTWPKWTAWLERRAEANKLVAAQKIVDAAKAAEKALLDAKAALAAKMPPIPPNPKP